MAAQVAGEPVFDGVNHLELIAVCVLIVSVALHSLILYIHKVTRKHRNVAQMLDRMFNEMMILGLISTILYFCEQSALFSHTELDRIHQIHLTLFFTVIGWVFTSILLLATSIYISFTWAKSEENIPSHGQLRSELDQLKRSLAETNFIVRPFLLGKWIRKNELESFFDFYEVRQEFINANHLSSTYNFGYYLRKCKRHVFLTLGGIHTSAWIAVSFVFLLDMMYRNYVAIIFSIPSFMASFQFYANGALIFLASVVTAMSLIVFFKCNKILKRMQKSDLIKFDALANNYIIRVNFEDGINDDLEYRQFSDMTRPARIYHHDRYVLDDGHRDIIEGVAVVVSESRYEYRPNRQQEMFWFGSHLVLLRFIQSLLAIMIITCSIMVAHYVVGGQILYTWTPVIIVILFILVFMLIASAIPLYTIIVHIGELADIKTAQEAARKIQQRKRSAKQAIEPAVRLALVSRTERILISSWMESLIHWLIVVNLISVAIPLVFSQDASVQYAGDVITLCITGFFLLEVLVRGSILSFSYFLIDWWTVVDCIVVVASFVAAIVQFWVPVVDITTVFLGMRLLESGRVWRIARKIKRARAMKKYQQRYQNQDPWDYSKDDIPSQQSAAAYVPHDDSWMGSTSDQQRRRMHQQSTDVNDRNQPVVQSDVNMASSEQALPSDDLESYGNALRSADDMILPTL